MPLTELMHYFNDQLQLQARTKALPKTGFYKVDKGYWARFGSLILGSQFIEIYKTPERENLLGHYSHLIVRSATGKNLSIDEIFNSLDDTDQIIHLDRLIRTLHSLNYLQQYDGQRGLLALTVQPRHIISVIAEHGKTFEGILSDCGLGPERVLLHTRLIDQSTLAHFRRALHSYKSRGYLVGISVEQKRDLALAQSLTFEPDIIFYRSTEFAKQPDWIAESSSKAFFPNSQRIFLAKNYAASPSDFDGYLLEPVGFSTDETNNEQFAG